MQAHGQRKRAGIGAPSNEELVQSKTPAEGRRAERAPEPSLLVRAPKATMVKKDRQEAVADEDALLPTGPTK